MLKINTLERYGIAEETAHRMMMREGSRHLRAALTGEDFRPLEMSDRRKLSPPAVPKAPAPRLVPRRPHERPQPIPLGLLGREVVQAVCAACEVTVADLLGPSRKAHLVMARSVAVQLLRDAVLSNGEPRFSLPRIGRMMHRDHSSILNLLHKFERRCEQHPELREIYDALRPIVPQPGEPLP